jgi:hypothetical protein
MSGLFNEASLVLVPSGYKSGKVYSEVPTNGDGDLTFTRASSATRVNSDGEIEVVGSGVPRLDYSQGSCPSLLLEPQRTNLMRNSEALNSWFKLDTSVTSDSTTSPDGTQNADTVTATGASSLSHLIYQNLAFTSGTAYTLSVFAKANTSDYIQLVLAGQFSATNYANFDLSNGTITASAVVTAKIEDYGNGWYRCSISATAGSSSTNSQIIYLINSGTASRGQSFTANGESVYLWGGQFEAGSYATSYIPTTSATVTRLRDRCIKTNFTGLSSQLELTLYAEFIHYEGGRVVSIGNGTASNRLFVSTTSLKQIQLYLNIGGTLAFFLSSSNNVVLNGKNKVAVKIKSGETLLYVNGIEILNNTTTFTLANMSNLYIATNEFGDIDNDTKQINSILIFYSALSDEELTTLTTL